MTKTTQLTIIRDVMLSARDCGEWLTLGELRVLTKYGEASISAQLRHLRKPGNGAHVVAKRYSGARGWEYQLGPQANRT